MTLSDERLREIAKDTSVYFGATRYEGAAMARELLSRRASPHGEAGVTVKPLEWGKVYSDGTGYVSIDARSIVGWHSVYQMGVGRWWKLEFNGKLIGKFDDRPSCQAAAQADYEARIRSALASPTAAPAHEGVTVKPLSDDERERCFICLKPFVEGDMVLPDVTEGLGHRECFGNTRDVFVKDIDTGEPLGPHDPLPTGFPWTAWPNELPAHRSLTEALAHCDTLDSCLETFWCITEAGSDNRLLADAAMHAARRIRSALLPTPSVETGRVTDTMVAALANSLFRDIGTVSDDAARRALEAALSASPGTSAGAEPLGDAEIDRSDPVG